MDMRSTLIRALLPAVVLAFSASGSALAAAPANDNFADAIPLGPAGSIVGNTLEATFETGEQTNVYAGGNASGYEVRTVWYRFTAAAGGRVKFDTCQSVQDTTIGVYTGTAVGALTRLTGNDGGCGSIFPTESFIDAVAGTTYYVSVAAFYRAGDDNAVGPLGAGPFTLRWNADGVTSVAAPVLTATDPAGPSNLTAIKVQGTAPAGSTVTLYKTANCAGDAVGSGSAAELSSPGLATTAPTNTTTTYSAKATKSGVTSDCSTSSVSYTNDSSAPAAPQFTSATSGPKVHLGRTILTTGTAEPGSRVDLYLTSTCTGLPVVTGSAAQFAGPGLIALVFTDPTRLWATATDAVGNQSACSRPISYPEIGTTGHNGGGGTSSGSGSPGGHSTGSSGGSSGGVAGFVESGGTPAVDLSLSAIGTRAGMARYKGILVQVSCGPIACPVTLGLRIRSGNKQIALVKKQVDVRAFTAELVTLHLTRKQRRAIRRHTNVVLELVALNTGDMAVLSGLMTD